MVRRQSTVNDCYLRCFFRDASHQDHPTLWHLHAVYFSLIPWKTIMIVISMESRSGHGSIVNGSELENVRLPFLSMKKVCQ